ncbi:IclR family transcriptional regulator [Dactylosporangium fulvum]|uniref:IclR family transcriptional regulator n=1 Tax=Dactylosporangium fulvum TaxID=53359 RepID=A0ABY5VRA3_9ACTN|nr:IclR family transcriptional regulator [Dactylosporangium fulvum]UWP80065.1 IclR family transcriptional regulator [Dactylosporangium fulvum]
MSITVAAGRTPPVAPEPPGLTGFGRTVERSYLVLGNLPADGGSIGVSEVARRTGLPKSTAYRILTLLTGLRLADRCDNGYRLGHRIIELAGQSGRPRASVLRDRLLPHLLDLFTLTGHAVYLGVPYDAGVLCLEDLHGHQAVPLPVRLGRITPAHRTAMGRVLLAFDADVPAGADAPGDLDTDLDRLRAGGIAVDTGTFRAGIDCVAAPVWAPGRRIAAAIMVAGPAGRVDIALVSRQVRQAAAGASRTLRADVTRR